LEFSSSSCLSRRISGGCRPSYFFFQFLFGLSLSLRWPRHCNSVENIADKKVSLNGGQVFSHDLIVEPQAKQTSRVAWNLKFNDDPLD
jgi:hypothetical protein